jgi:N-acetylated-alpha-linked acidic dipeptidase
VLRLANADALPFEFTNFADTIGQYVDEVTRLTDTMREDTKRMNQLISSGMWQAVQDPTQNLAIPAIKDDVPQVDFEPLKNALARLRESANYYQRASSGRQPSAAAQKSLDEILYKTERALTRTEGLPRRDWFRHQIYAPGFYTGYGVKTLPGVREAIEQRDWREAREQIGIVSRVLDGFAPEIDRAAKLF